jgi:hypothetical protein
MLNANAPNWNLNVRIENEIADFHFNIQLG